MSSSLLRVLPREARLVFLANGQPDVETDVCETLDDSIDWNRLTLLAEREGATPMLLATLDRAGVQLPEAAEQLRRMARVSSFRMHYVEQRLHESTTALAAAGVPSLLLKGAALASSVYPSFADRPMADLDILVAPDRAEVAVEALLGAGWRWPGGLANQPLGRARHHLPELMDSRGVHLSCELHTAMFPVGDPFHLDQALVARAATAARGLPQDTRIPAREHLLLHACTHFVWGHFMRLHAWRVFRDVRALLGAGALDWDAFLDIVRTTNAGTCCYWTLRLARDVVGVPIPAERLATLRPPLPERVLRLIARHLTTVLLPTTAECPSIRLRRVWWSAAVMPGWSGHGAIRPWDVMALDADTAWKAQRARDRAIVDTIGPGAVQLWLRYLRTLAARESGTAA